ncbi:MAG: cupin domain-containing protein [Flavobacteriaceae bacterium]|jgi:mannose-6-phosphate isomerase-like protein (cupin superfamily)|nr:cupin domain-containing protein [Flavobacteriaceae bacterium]|tara:strand:+ start:377 stop:739 length:363 start_codon:yes stop_codon:yes gene_type:complete
MKKINLKEKFLLFEDHWSPKIIAELNGQLIKVAKVKGEFVWHDHANEDELFMIIKGSLRIEFKEKETVVLNEGEILIVPRGIEHKPVAEEEVWLMLFEPRSTKHTGTVKNKLTQTKQEKI